MYKIAVWLVGIVSLWPVQSSFGQAGKAERVRLQKKYVDEIATLASHPKLLEAFTLINDLEPETRKEHILLTEIPAPPFKEEKRAKKFAELLQQIGVDRVWIDEVGNVLALRKGVKGGKTILVEAHLDTVFPEETDVSVKVSGDTLKAPGIGDDTRGLAVLLAGLKILNQLQIKTEADILWAGTVGEEGLGDLRGIKHLFNTPSLTIDSHIALDGVGIGRIVNSAVGSIRYRIKFKGPGGHSFGAFGLANPHHALGRTIAEFVEKADEYTRTGEKTTYNIGVIGGGTSVNAIPYESWLEVDMRSENASRLAELERLFLNAVESGLQRENEIRKMGEELTAEIIKVGDRPSGSIPESAPLVQRAAASAAHLGTVPMLGASSTNSNTPLSLGIPSVTIGSGGNAGGAHSLDEWWINENGHLGIQHLLLVLLAESGIKE